MFDVDADHLSAHNAVVTMKRDRALLFVALLVGLLGVGVTLVPGLWAGGGCPTWAKRLVPAWLTPTVRGWFRGGGGEAAASPAARPRVPKMTRAELAKHTGADGGRILLAVGGDVYDVTEKGKDFYGPGATYAQFAGTDATRALALGSLDREELNKPVSDLNEEQTVELGVQLEFYRTKYGPRVARLRG